MSQHVKVYKYEQSKEDPKSFSKVFDYEGVLLGFGLDYEQFELSAGMFSTGIVERSDGYLDNVPLDRIRMVSKADYDYTHPPI